MAEETKISWCDRTWSPWYGCTQVSMGEKGACVGCYARHLSETRMHRVVFGGPGRGEGTRDVRADSAWKDPIRWDRDHAKVLHAWDLHHREPGQEAWRESPPRCLVFPSMCDPFDNHPDLAEPRRRFFDLIRATPNLTWLLLTKRPGNIVKLFREAHPSDPDGVSPPWEWPSNAAIGCTVVTQEEADRDVPKLLAAKAALDPAFAFLSMEPLLGPVDLTWLPHLGEVEDDGPDGVWDVLRGRAWIRGDERWDGAPIPNWRYGDGSGGPRKYLDAAHFSSPTVDWVITGGETDQGKHRARPSCLAWFRSIRDQCAAAGVAYHHKQNGEWVDHFSPEAVGAIADGGLGVRNDTRTRTVRVGKKLSGRLLDGVLHDARPEVRHEAA